LRLNSTVINKKVHEELNIPISDIDAISNSIFSSLNDWFRDPTSLIVWVRGLGKFYARKKKISDRMRSLEIWSKTNPEFDNSKQVAKFNFLISEYDKFLYKKQQYKLGIYDEFLKKDNGKKSSNEECISISPEQVEKVHNEV
jgi:hypothetical protein